MIMSQGCSTTGTWRHASPSGGYTGLSASSEGLPDTTKIMPLLFVSFHDSALCPQLIAFAANYCRAAHSGQSMPDSFNDIYYSTVSFSDCVALLSGNTFLCYWRYYCNCTETAFRVSS